MLRVLMIMTLIHFFYSLHILRNAIHDVGLPVVIPRWIKIFIVGIFVPALAAIAISTILVFVLNLALQISNSRAQEAQDLRVVLYDLKFLMKEVIRIKEANGGDDDHPEISAYAALLSLRKVLDSILESGGGLRFHHNRAQLKSLHAQLTFLLDFLGNASAYMASQEPELQILEATIKDEVYKVQQLIEFQIPAQFLLDSDRKSFLRSTKFLFLASQSSVSALAILTTTHISTTVSRAVVVALGFGTLVLCRRLERSEVSTSIQNSEMEENHEMCLIINNLSVIVNNLSMIKDAAYANLLSTLPAATADASSRRDLRGTRNVVVGLERDTKEIKARLTQDSSKLEVISIVGMGGIGKTTLATQVYNDPGIPYLFDVRAWVTVSQEYSLRHVLLGLLDSAKILPEEKCEDNDEELTLYLYQYLMFRRYFLVIDDVWDTKIWDFLSRFFPDNCNGSRVLLTSRLTDVASYPDSDSPLHLMQCLDENESWYLLHEKVFGVEACPSELDSAGREIARSCGGLPLAILVIGGLLYKDKRSETCLTI